MRSSSKRIIFNADPPERMTAGNKRSHDVANDQLTYIPSGLPIVPLELLEEVPRNPRQHARITEFLARQRQVAEDPAFGPLLGWAYRCYKVGAIHRSRTNDAAAAIDDRIFQEHIYLFNVIVALEWYPSRPYLRQLEWAFRRGSNFLYDVTDGYMAFGQVVFGGPELMDCADIQVLASNRLNPRSWVGSLHDAEKYMPIRLGRGVWHKNNRVSIPWDEPEGYRTLIHEWAHYALELRDEYLETRTAFLPGRGDLAHLPDQVLVSGAYTLVIPKISLALESIMATLEGTSELVPHRGGSSAKRKSKEWATMAQRYPNIDPNHQPLEGPAELPLPLPRFHRLSIPVRASLQAAQPNAGGARHAPAPQPGDEVVLNDFPKGILFDHCWVYVIQGPEDDPKRILAQGTFDARAAEDGFQLLGAGKGDTIVLIGADTLGQPAVVCGTIADLVDQLVTIKAWRAVTPAFPLIDVLPGPVKPNDPMAEIRVRVINTGKSPLRRAWIFPFGQLQPEARIAIDWSDQPDWTSPPQSVPTLDGHVLLRWEDGTLAIGTFSQGGGPATHIPGPPPSITAGSSEGNVMLFFENREQDLDHSDVRVVTTLVPGGQPQLPNGAKARSYVFSLASNQPLPQQLNPTLIMHYDATAARDGGDLLIHRQMGDDGTKWEPLPTYLPPGSSFAATPLNAETATKLVALTPGSERVERYRLYLTPRKVPGERSERMANP